MHLLLTSFLVKLSTHPESTVARNIYKILPCRNEILHAVLDQVLKTGFKSSAREDATFHSTFILHIQIGGKLENNLNKLLKMRTVHVLYQTTVPTSHH